MTLEQYTDLKKQFFLLSDEAKTSELGSISGGILINSCIYQSQKSPKIKESIGKK